MHEFLRRIRFFFHRADFDRDLDEEMRDHIARLEESGRVSEEARRQFEQEKPWAAGEHFEAGWGVLTLSHGMTDWRSVEPTDTRRGIA